MTKANRVVYELDEHGYWVVDISGFRHAHTQARTIATARERVREVIALVTEQAVDSVEIGEEDFRLPAKVAVRVAAARKARERAEWAEADLVVKLREAAAAVVAITGTRDAGELLGLSHGRVHQLVAYGGARVKAGGARPARKASATAASSPRRQSSTDR